jgi:glycerol-3-phosphate acyltransferase PlsX
VTRVAVDLLGCPSPPEGVDGILAALGADPDLAVTIVGPPHAAGRALADRRSPVRDRIRLAPASRAVAPGPDAVREVRAHRDAAVRVAARMVRDGHADAMVSAGPAEAVVAAAHFTLGLVEGATRPALGAVLRGRAGPVVVCDVGAAAASADELVQFALAGAAYATARLGVAEPRVGLLAARPALLDPLRSTADAALRTLGLGYVGPIGAETVVSGAIDVVVTDGFTGEVMCAALRAATDGGGFQDRSLCGTGGVGAAVLGVDGVAVCAYPDSARGEGAPPGQALAGAVAAAAAAQRARLVPSLRSAMSGLLARRRATAGMAP